METLGENSALIGSKGTDGGSVVDSEGDSAWTHNVLSGPDANHIVLSRPIGPKNNREILHGKRCKRLAPTSVDVPLRLILENDPIPISRKHWKLCHTEKQE